MQIYNPTFKNKTSFGGLLHIDKKTENINDSWFFRDYPTLSTATEHLKKAFPKGGEILDYACSNGEEVISLNCLLDDPKFKIIGYDCSNDALRLGNRGVYTLFANWYDSYLMQNQKIDLTCNESDSTLPDSKTQTILHKKFHQMMQKTDPLPEYKDINNKSNFNYLRRFYNLQEEFYIPKPTLKKRIDLRRGDIKNITQRRTDMPVIAVFFRNALYQLCENNIDEGLFNQKPINTNINRREIIKELVNNIHKVLEKDGIFIIGTHIKEHLFWADNSMKQSSVEKLSNNKFFVNSKYNYLKPEALCAKISPLVKALVDGGRFVPIGFSNVSDVWGSLKIPTIWKKIK